MRVNRDKLQFRRGERIAITTFHLVSAQIRGQMYKVVRGMVDYAHGFHDRPEIFAKDKFRGYPHDSEEKFDDRNVTGKPEMIIHARYSITVIRISYLRQKNPTVYGLRESERCKFIQDTHASSIYLKERKFDETEASVHFSNPHKRKRKSGERVVERRCEVERKESGKPRDECAGGAPRWRRRARCQETRRKKKE
ncbi:hypothetical protein PUN28_002590 [Cardiocondyla obscurior]|uniref:Uncharacterized protein n=1 Tax=Cardiocondyla obscurior TaxID=286306 RepID=A0AAW2GV20_9HYME